MLEATWYLGPLGDMRPLVVPEPGIQISQVRYGGIHQGLSGARSLDITGYRTEYNFEFRNLEQDEYLWLEALHYRLVPGPFYLLDPLKKNRLTAQSSRLDLTNYNNSGIDLSGPYEVTRDWPTDIRIPGRSKKLTDWGASQVVTFDPSKPAPLLDGETLTGSIYIKGDAAYADIDLRVTWYTEDLVEISSTDIADGTSTEWTRVWYTYHDQPTNARAASLSLVLGAYSTPVYIAAPMLEAGVTWPSDWDMGGAAPVVIMDQIPASSGRYPLRNVELNLLEA